MDEQDFDVVVIGGGSGGYIAAIRAAQLGFKVACVDQWTSASGGPALGGTCTNTGCIPSKALLQSSQHFEQIAHHVGEHGITVSGLAFDVAQTMKRKVAVVKKNNDGILYLFKKNGVRFFHGLASFVSSGELGFAIRVVGSQEERLVGKHVVIATGSNARSLPGIAFDEDRILSNDGALRLAEVPRRLALIGAGVIGLEMGSVWRRLGAEVTVLEALPALLPAVDQQIAKEAHKIFLKQGLKIELGVTVAGIETTSSGVTVRYKSAGGQDYSLEVDRVVVSVGRVPNTVGLNTEAIGLRLDARGGVEVDNECKTNVANVWAIGDVVRGPMLAHKAEEEGVAVAERIAGRRPEVDFNTIPWVIYTHPEIAWVGETEEQLRASGHEYKKGVIPFTASGRARALGDTAGMVKLLADAHTDEVLGVHIIGPTASELVAEAVIVMEFRGSAEDIALISHAHPTLGEVTKEAALAANNRALNF
jgi:dihydrolipoamide dehydrogenase